RSKRDWSSDVCSSDLALEAGARGYVLADQLDGFLWRRALQDVSASSGFQRALDFHVTFERRLYDNQGVGEFCLDGKYRVETTLRLEERCVGREAVSGR